MYDLWVAIVIGIVEGLTEFLPVSSTGHMILTSYLLGVDENDQIMKTFTIAIQFGAILAVVVLYWKRILRLFGIRDKSKPVPPGGGLNLLHILIGIVPAMGIAFLAQDLIKSIFMTSTMVLLSLVAGGVFLIAGEKFQPKTVIEDMDEMSYKQAFFIGIAQILSLWSGFSRSGATIAGGMLSGLSRKAAADFTFLMAVPIMAAACGYELLESYQFFTADLLTFFAVGFIVSFVVALLAVASFIKWVGSMKLTYFAYYRFALAILFFLYMTYMGS
jgi:undecaprenyl-diphosphatase